GAGDRASCTGGDQKQRAETGDYGPSETGLFEVEYMHRLIREVPKPVIAAVNGYAIGGGHVLHVLCDLTIAADSARFGQTGPRVGSFDAGFGTGYLARVVGEKRAREIWFLCRQYDAETAERWSRASPAKHPYTPRGEGQFFLAIGAKNGPSPSLYDRSTPVGLVAAALGPGGDLEVLERGGGVAALGGLGLHRPAANPQVRHQTAMARLDVAQDRLSLALEGRGELVQSVAQRLGLGQHLVRGLLGGLDPLVGLLARDLGDAYRLRLRLLLQPRS